MDVQRVPVVLSFDSGPGVYYTGGRTIDLRLAHAQACAALVQQVEPVPQAIYVKMFPDRVPEIAVEPATSQPGAPQ